MISTKSKFNGSAKRGWDEFSLVFNKGSETFPEESLPPIGVMLMKLGVLPAQSHEVNYHLCLRSLFYHLWPPLFVDWVVPHLSEELSAQDSVTGSGR